MAYTPTLEDFDEAVSSPKDESFLTQAGQAAKKYITDPVESARIPEIAGGFLQSAAQGAESLANLPLGLLSTLSGKDLTLPYTNFQQYAKQDPMSRLAFSGGELGGYLVPASMAMRGARGALGSVMKPSLVTEGLAGAFSGYGTTGNEDPKTRALATALGGVAPVATSLLSGKIAKTISNKRKNLEKVFKKRYDDSVFAPLKEAGLDNARLRVPQDLTNPEMKKDLVNAITGKTKFLKSSNRFAENPTFQNAHDAQSDLGKLSREFKRAKDAGKVLTSEEARGDRLVKALQRKIRGSQQDFLIKNNAPKILKNYGETTRDYAKQLAPYKQPIITKYQSGAARPRDVVKNVMSNEDFMSPTGPYKDIPGLGTRRALRESGIEDLLKKALMGAAIGGGGTLAFMAGMPLLGKMLQK